MLKKLSHAFSSLAVVFLLASCAHVKATTHRWEEDGNGNMVEKVTKGFRLPEPVPHLIVTSNPANPNTVSASLIHLPHETNYTQVNAPQALFGTASYAFELNGGALKSFNMSQDSQADELIGAVAGPLGAVASSGLTALGSVTAAGIGAAGQFATAALGAVAGHLSPAAMNAMLAGSVDGLPAISQDIHRAIAATKEAVEKVEVIGSPDVSGLSAALNQMAADIAGGNLDLMEAEDVRELRSRLSVAEGIAIAITPKPNSKDLLDDIKKSIKNLIGACDALLSGDRIRVYKYVDGQWEELKL